MKNINQPQKRSISVLVRAEGISSENTDNIRQAIVMLLNSHPKIFEGKKSPQEILHLLGFHPPKNPKPKTGRWARMVERSKKIRMSPEATQIMEEASQQFREEFAFNHELDEKK